jgi:GNAT superfamily N-acetyltransferase
MNLIKNLIIDLNNLLSVSDIRLEGVWLERNKRVKYQLSKDILYQVSEPTGIDINVWSGTNFVATFHLCQLKGCCGICLTTGEYVEYPYRKNGIGTRLAKFRMDVAREYGYTILLCTDVIDNIPQKKILSKFGWKDILRFQNYRTLNTVDISAVSLRDDMPMTVAPKNFSFRSFVKSISFGFCMGTLVAFTLGCLIISFVR